MKPKGTPTAESHPVPLLASNDGDSFWDEALASTPAAAKPTTLAAVVSPAATESTRMLRSDQTSRGSKEKKPNAKKRIRWGFDWGKVAGGGITFLIAGGITAGLVLTTGRLFFWPAGIAVVGLFTMLSGLMGEEGIW